MEDSQETQEDRKVDNIAILVIFGTAILMAVHFMSGWVPGG